MKTFDEAMKVIACKSEADGQELIEKQKGFLNDLESSELFKQMIDDALQSCRSRKQLEGFFISMFFHGMIVGREMEKAE